MNLGDSELLPGESLLWSGDPKRRRFFEIEELPPILVLVAWIVVAFVLVRHDTSSGGSDLTLLVSTPFLLAFCYFMFGRPLLLPIGHRIRGPPQLQVAAPAPSRSGS